MKQKAGFTLITLSIILTVASLVFVATLPGIQTSLKASAASVTRMNSILSTMRGYMAAYGVLPCPADPTLAIGASNYGVAAANPGTNVTTGNCIGSAPAAAYADTSKNIAIGMVPVKTLGLSYADALDAYGRDITYAVDTNATGNSTGGPCWSSSSLAGAITVSDNGVNYNTVAVLVSHGADGYGAWLPLSGTSGTASRYDNGSTDTSQAANAQVATGGGLTALTSGHFVNFVRQAATSTFDDSVVYKSNIYTLNTLPTSAQVYPAITPPSNGTYSSGQVLTFTITYASNVTVTGTPQLDLSAISGSIGTGNVAYATYQSGSGTASLTFSYTVQNTDTAPTSGLTMNAYIDLNGGTLSGGSTCFTAPSLTGVLIGSNYYRTVTIDHTKVGSSNSSNFPMLFSGTYTYLKTVANGGTVTNASGYDIYFTSDAAGHSLLPFERVGWSASTGAVVFWVQVPTVSHTADTVIYLQYANSGITTDQSNKTGVWDSNYLGVWHLEDNAANTTVANSSANANTGAAARNTSLISTGGKIADGFTFNGSSDLINTNNSGSINGQAQVTISAWVNTSSLNGNQYDIYDEPNNASASTKRLGLVLSGAGCSSNKFCLYGRTHDGDSSTVFIGSSTALSTSTWYYVVAVYDSVNSLNHLMVNGVDQTNSLTEGTFSATTPFHVPGIGEEADGTHLFTGTIDEVRVSKTARSVDWNTTEYNNQNSPGTFYTVGAQTSR